MKRNTDNRLLNLSYAEAFHLVFSSGFLVKIYVHYNFPYA